MADTTNSISARLAELGIELPAVAAPVAAYVPAVQTGNIVYTSGQLPFVDGELTHVGHVTSETPDADAGEATDVVSADDAKIAARTACLNALAAVDALVGIDNVVRIVKVTGFVSSAAGFNGQPGVINGASELLGEIFGDAGQHARSAVGVNELPLNTPVEVELMVEVSA
ncbi:RidA family protein [Corynebacterium sp. H78]|uniref:RidA family protein n=1 Tax=Corynebacterium sp. H78 TaxID=3133417 RepID=UPI00309AA0FE